MLDEERRISILNKIQADGKVIVSVLAKKYQVSESTIRRDLTSLENSGFIKRTHGGAILQGNANENYFYDKKRNTNINEKQLIAQKAAALVKPNTIIFLGTSTSTELMAQYISVSTLTVVTNSIDVINVISKNPNYNLIVIGGNYINSARTIEGGSSLEQLQHLHFHQAFLGANGIDLQFGISTSSDIESRSKNLVIQNSSEVFFLCESTKFNNLATYKVCNLSDVSGIISEKLDTDVYNEYSKKCTIIM